VLKHADLKLQPGEALLDICSGDGPHSRLFAEKTGAKVDARDLGEVVLTKGTFINETGQNSPEIDEATFNTRKKIVETVGYQVGDINYRRGDMGNIKESIEDGKKYKAITIMGTSFMYLPDHESHQKALNDYIEILEPGGKLVIQWYERDRNIQRNPYWLEGSRYEIKPVGKEFDPWGRTIDSELIFDKEKGDGMYTSHEEKPEGYERVDHPYGEMAGTNLRRSHFARVYKKPNGEEVPYPETEVINYLEKRNFPILKAMLEKAGFTNVKLIPEGVNGVPLSADGNRRLYGVVGEKPAK
jgi:SAM-dependent methyltransferase